jgi:FlaA1/EpsC-like NDP-sugar epimerase
VQFHPRKYRKQIIFLLDIGIILSAYSVFSLLLTHDDIISYYGVIQILPHMGLLIICNTISHHFLKTYDSLWRYAESKEYLSLILGGSIGFSSFLVVDYVIFHNPIPILFLMAVYSVSLLLMLLMRFYYRILRNLQFHKKSLGKIPIAIIGAGTAGVRLLDEIRNDPNSKYSTYCFIDDSIEKVGKYIHHIRVMGPIKDIYDILQGTPVREVILAMPLIPPAKRSEILNYCSSLRCSIKILPDTLFLMQMENESLAKNIRDVNIEELLGREPVVLDGSAIHQFISDKVVMVTGGGGSIGSELCRQLAKEHPKQLIIVDIYENNAYEIQQEL